MIVVQTANTVKPTPGVSICSVEPLHVAEIAEAAVSAAADPRSKQYRPYHGCQFSRVSHHAAVDAVTPSHRTAATIESRRVVTGVANRMRIGCS